MFLSANRKRRIFAAGGIALIGSCLAIPLAHFKFKRDFFVAVGAGDVETVSRLLKWDPHLVYSVDELGSTALISAAENGSVELVKLLIARGSDVNQDSHHAMPLHIAAYLGRAGVVAELLKSGADLNAESNRSTISLTGTPLHQAAAGGNADVVRLLLDYGANVNAKERQFNRTPLHFAVNSQPKRETRLEVIELLLSRGADVNALDSYGHSALNYVMADPKNSKEKTDMIETLESHGAK